MPLYKKKRLVALETALHRIECVYEIRKCKKVKKTPLFGDSYFEYETVKERCVEYVSLSEQALIDLKKQLEMDKNEFVE